MSFGVCRVEKIKGAAAVAGLQIHNNRERMHSNTNPDIDRNRSELNYSLIKQSSYNYNKLIEERLQQGYKGKKAIRKDAVKMCEMLFTSDGEFFSRLSEQEQRQFFLDCFEFAAQRYGRENIITATVHLDEATPHLHLDFVPLTPDGRLSAKDILGGRKEMQQLQDDFYSTVSSNYGLERGSRADLESGEHSRKHLETAEYKEKLARERTRQAEQAIQTASQRIQEAEQQKNDLQSQIQEQQQQLSRLQQQITAAEQELTYRQNILSKVKFSTDERYCYFGTNPQVFDKLQSISKEFNLIFNAIQREDGLFILQAPSSEKEYLSVAIAKAKILVKNDNNQPPQNPSGLTR